MADIEDSVTPSAPRGAANPGCSPFSRRLRDRPPMLQSRDFAHRQRGSSEKRPERSGLYNLEVLLDRGDGNPDQQLSPGAIRTELEKILSSRIFVQSPQLCRFLRFVVDQELAGQGAQMKEYLLGVEVFRKEESFDPRLDTVVRTVARRLRNKLAEYYQTEGQADVAEIALPKGSYRP